MHSKSLSKTRLNTILITLISLITICITMVGLLISSFTGKIRFDILNLIDYASLILFMVCCAFAVQKERNYFFLLPFIFIAFPTAVNNFMPGVNLGKEYPPTIFPFITHIDLFLILGILKSYYFNRRFYVRSTFLMTIVLVLFILSSLINLIQAQDSHLIALLIAGLFPVRYLILIIFLVSNTDIFRYEKQIIYGLVISVFFLLLESSVNTIINPNNEGVLASGSLAANTFANIIAAIMVFFIILRRNNYKLSTFLFYPIIVSCCTIILLTETRMAVLAALASFLFIKFFEHNFLKSFFVVLTFVILFAIIYINVEVPQRYSLKYLSSKIEFKGWSSDPLKMLEIERTPETSSLLSRLELFSASLNMLYKNPLFGTGYGTFNYLKNDHGFDEEVLIDAHNGYLNTLSQLGLSSIFLLYFIYIYPFRHFHQSGNTFLKWLFVINTTMAIADLSNAGIYKYSVFALLAFNSVVLSNLKNK